jgi:hypothetical protein
LFVHGREEVYLARGGLSRQIESIGAAQGAAGQKKREVLTEHLPKVASSNET